MSEQAIKVHRGEIWGDNVGRFYMMGTKLAVQMLLWFVLLVFISRTGHHDNTDKCFLFLGLTPSL